MSYSDLILTTPCLQEYTIKRTYSTEDCAGNYAEHIQYITIDDTTAPEFTAFPADETVECDAVPAVADLNTLAAADNCDPVVDIAYTGEVRTDGACEDTYTLTRTWETTDCAGNVHSQKPDHRGSGHDQSRALHRVPGRPAVLECLFRGR